MKVFASTAIAAVIAASAFVAGESFRPGERVRLLSGGGVTRITH